MHGPLRCPPNLTKKAFRLRIMNELGQRLGVHRASHYYINARLIRAVCKLGCNNSAVFYTVVCLLCARDEESVIPAECERRRKTTAARPVKLNLGNDILLVLLSFTPRENCLAIFEAAEMVQRLCTNFYHKDY